MHTTKARDLLFALLLAALTAGALGLAQTQQGVTRDEGTYFSAAEAYWGWFAELSDNIKRGRTKDSFTVRSITQHFSANNEHPVLMKTLFALSWRLFSRPAKGEAQKPSSIPVLSEISAFRLPAWIISGLGIGLLFLFGLRIESRLAGVVAALLYVSMPRPFFHGQLACFDAPITVFWLAVVYGYLRSLESPRWAIYTGLLFGLALAVKHNAWFLPPLLLVHYLIVIWPDLSLRPLALPRIPLVFVAMAVLGPIVFFAHWPWLWFDTIKHLGGYIGFHLNHAYYNIEYLGQNLGPPPLPMSYPFVVTLLTVPTVIIVLAAVGAWLHLRVPLLGVLSRWVGVRSPASDDRFRFPARRTWTSPAQGLDPRLGLLLGLNALFPIALIALPSTPHFGGEKHFMNAFPFLCLLAGIAVSRLIAAVRARWESVARIAALVLPVALAVPGALSTVWTHPFGLSQYNALAGGPAGGADLGMNRQFWGYATRQALPWMNATLPTSARVYFHDTSWDAYRAYQREGALRGDIAYAGMERPAIDASDHALVLHELHFNKYDYWIWDAYGTYRPVKVLSLDGVPLVSVYARPRAPAPVVRPKRAAE